MLEKLTPEQEAMLPIIRDKYIAIGLATGPCDRPAVEAACDLAYQKAGLQPPKLKLWFDSPGSLVDGIKAYYPDEEDIIQNCIHGSHDSPWLCYYGAFSEFGIDCSLLDGLFGMLKCGWWYPTPDVAFLSELPTEIHIVEENLHNTDGPSVAYRDGFAVYSLFGNRVPSTYIEAPETLDISEIYHQTVERIKDHLIKLHGPEKYNQKVVEMEKLQTLTGQRNEDK